MRAPLRSVHFFGYLAALLGPAAVTAGGVLFSPHVNDTAAALGIVLVVLVVAVRWGSHPAMLGALWGVVLFNFYLLPPTGTREFRNAENWVALAAFLITAVTAGELSARARQRAIEAEQGRKEARQASAYNRSLIEASLDPLVTIGKDGKITDTNLAAEGVTGYTRLQLIGTDFSEYFSEPERARAVYQQVFREGTVRDYPLEIRHRDGHTTPVVYNASVYRGENSEIAGVFAAARDITRRKQAEKEIRLLARLQAAVAELGQAALASYRAEEVLDQAVASVARTLEVEYCKILELLPGGKELLLRSGIGWNKSCIGRAKVGAGADSQAGYTLTSKLPVVVEDLRTETRFSGPALLHDHGVISGMSVVINTTEGTYGVIGAHTTSRRSFTRDEVQFLQAAANIVGMAVDRSRAEAALIESEISLNKAQEIAHLGSWHLDLTTNRLAWSDEVFRIFGVPPGSPLSYEVFLGLVHPDDREKVDRAWIEALGGAPYDLEHRILARGETKWVRERAKIQFAENGLPIGGDGTVQDVTERKLAEAEIRALNADLEERVHARTAELDAARDREVDLGFRIQQTLLLEQPPADFPGLRIAVLTVPSQGIDGDFYTFLQHRERSLDVIVGDVMGKGSPAALLGAATKSHFLRAFSELVAGSKNGNLPEPKEIVMLAHAGLAQHLIDLGSFVTLCYARLEMDRRTLDLVDCGHTGMVHWHGGAGFCDVVHGDNLPLGIREGEIYNQLSIPFEPGDIFLFFSDGITEARDPSGDLFGTERLREFVRANAGLPPDELVTALHQSVRRYAEAGRLTDDLTSVVIRVDPREVPLTCAASSFHSDLRNLRDARRFVRAFCEGVPEPLLDPDSVGKLELAVNEAASNIMKHACGGSADQVIRIEGEAFPSRISIRLRYFGPLFDPPPVQPPDLDVLGESGMGMYLMAASVDEVRHYRDRSGRNCVSLMKSRTP